MNPIQSLTPSLSLRISAGMFAPVLATTLIYELSLKITEATLGRFQGLKKYTGLIALALTIGALNPLLSRCIPLLFAGANPALTGLALAINGVFITVIGCYQIVKLKSSAIKGALASIDRISPEVIDDQSAKASQFVPFFGYSDAIGMIGKVQQRPEGQRNLIFVGERGSEPQLLIDECARLSEKGPQSPLYKKKVVSLNGSLLYGLNAFSVENEIRYLSQFKGEVVLILDFTDSVREAGACWQVKKMLALARSGRITVIGLTTEDRYDAAMFQSIANENSTFRVKKLDHNSVYEGMKRGAAHEIVKAKYPNIAITDKAIALATLLSYESSNRCFHYGTASILLIDILELLKKKPGPIQLDQDLFVRHWSYLYERNLSHMSIEAIDAPARSFFEGKGLDLKEISLKVTELNRRKPNPLLSEPSAREEAYAENMMKNSAQHPPLFGRDPLLFSIETILQRPAGMRNMVLLGEAINQPELVAQECARRAFVCIDPLSSFYRKAVYSLNAGTIIGADSAKLTAELKALENEPNGTILVVEQIDLLKEYVWKGEILGGMLKSEKLSILGISSPSKYNNIQNLSFAQNLVQLHVGPIEAAHCFQSLEARNQQFTKAMPHVTIKNEALALATLLSFHYVSKCYSLKDAVILISDILSSMKKGNRPIVLDDKLLWETWRETYSQKTTKISLASVSPPDREFFASKGISADRIAAEILEINKKKRNASNQSDVPSFLLDMNEAAREGKYPPCIGREEEVRTILQKLRQPKNKSAVLLGPPGIGKTALFEEIARRIAKGDETTVAIKDKTLYWVDVPALISTEGYVGQLSAQVSSLLQFARSRAASAVFVIDELHHLRGAGRYQGNNTDVLEMIKNALARDEIVVLGTANDYLWDPIVKKDPAIQRRIKSIKVNPPTAEACIEMLTHTNRSGYYTQGYEPSYIEVTDNAIRAAVLLTEKYQRDRFLPDKATSLISEAVSYFQDEQERSPSQSSSSSSSSSQSSGRKKITASEIAYCLYPSIKDHPEFKPKALSASDPRSAFASEYID